ncbi:bZIP transcription factor 27-like [Dioscorea cayenensis subsp. rotundata]|uniref:BZIP transcription factor 27-like n=1 Tax=Dioscorea cayennensis subsp. rotundata TaxID=55577 RepID=A0AB40CF99_DIOCR|nr:bZIP transcription factor 27-like [Dioscorea cayenensis subsp. rotundata]
MWSETPTTSTTTTKTISITSTSTSTTASILPQTPRRTMEEVWKDINFPTLHERPMTPPILPIDHPRLRTSITSTTSHPFRGVILQDFLAGAFKSPIPPSLPPPPPPPPPPRPPPPTILSLNSAMDSGSFPFPLRPPRRSSDSGDRRHKRMIKNRESAARSRARKQAYTNELELEVAHLVEENAKLRKQHDEMITAMAAQQTKKRTLQRTSTAPF